jgi:hypothetical protein
MNNDQSIFEIQKNCNHELVYDYGYIKRVCNRCKVSTSRELAHYRNLRCILCEKDIHAYKDDEMFDRKYGLIDASLITFNEIHNIVENNINDDSKNEVLNVVKKYVKSA